MADPVEKQLAFEDLDRQLGPLLDTIEYSELYGYDLRNLSGSLRDLSIRECLLNKFLKANKYSVPEAKNQLEKTLKWRKEFNPLSAAFKEKHDPQLDKLGVITKANGMIATWNLYGAVSNREELFSKLDEFIRWRVGLMERGISLLDFSKPDVNSTYMMQTHDYFDVSFFRLDAATKAASQKTIQLFQDYYPEFVSRKFFVNVPLIMSWMFSLAKTFMSSDTVKKLSMLSDGKQLAGEIGKWVPEKYGGNSGVSLESIEAKDFKKPEIWQKKEENQETGPADQEKEKNEEKENEDEKKEKETTNELPEKTAVKEEQEESDIKKSIEQTPQ